MAGTAGIVTCPDCGHPVRWTITQAGKRLAIDPEPTEEGNTAVYRDGTGTWRSRRPNEELPAQPWERICMPHVATCTPEAVQLQLDLKLPEGVADFTAYRRKRGR